MTKQLGLLGGAKIEHEDLKLLYKIRRKPPAQKNQRIITHVTQIPDKPVGSNIKIDSNWYKVEKVVYKMGKQKVDMVTMVLAWWAYRVQGEHQGIKFSIEYNLKYKG